MIGKHVVTCGKKKLFRHFGGNHSIYRRVGIRYLDCCHIDTLLYRSVRKLPSCLDVSAHREGSQPECVVCSWA